MARKPVTTNLEADLIRKLKYLSADTDRNLNDLLEEAIEDLIKKHEKKAKK
jgi:predicted transcriptional regulator